MDRNELATKLLAAIKDGLEWLGIPRGALDRADEIIFMVFIVIIGLAIAAVTHFILAQMARRILKRRKIGVVGSMLRYGVFRKLTSVIPPLIVIALLPFAFGTRSEWYSAGERVAWICFFVALTFSVNAILRTLGDALQERDGWRNRPMKGFIQIFQVLFSSVAAIIVVSIVIGKSPANLITGLGAFAAVLMLVFKDTILGFVAGVMITEDDMLRIGDWIEMPQNNINGTVTDISLDIVKVTNFDNTTVTIPPYSLVSGSFINWRGMEESGGRRIMREYVIKLDGITPCSAEFLERMKGFDRDLAEYITAKQRQAEEGRAANTENPEYLLRYLDMFYTEIGEADINVSGVSSWLGTQGVNWDITEDGQCYYRIVPEDTEGLSEEEYKNKYVIDSSYVGTVVLDLFPINNPTQEMKAYESAENYDPSMKDRLMDGFFKYDANENAELTAIQADINTYVDTAIAQFITGVADIENDWENFLQTLDAMQLPRLLEIEQAAYDRLMGEE